MANLIIKSSADNLVLQGSDASPALTVAAAGQTTFAENATLSGTANALGTVASGTLGSAVVAQGSQIGAIVSYNKAGLYGDYIMDQNSGSIWYPGLVVTGTPNSSSDVIMVNMQYLVADTTSNTGHGVTFETLLSGGSYTAWQHSGTHSFHSSSSNEYRHIAWRVILKPSQISWSSGVISIRLGFMNQSTDSVEINGASGSSDSMYNDSTYGNKTMMDMIIFSSNYATVTSPVSI